MDDGIFNEIKPILHSKRLSLHLICSDNETNENRKLKDWNSWNWEIVSIRLERDYLQDKSYSFILSSNYRETETRFNHTLEYTLLNRRDPIFCFYLWGAWKWIIYSITSHDQVWNLRKMNLETLLGSKWHFRLRSSPYLHWKESSNFLGCAFQWHY